MKLRLTISRAILIFGLVTATGLGAVIATSVYGLAQLKVGGPLYNQIKLGNDLIADILPPPEYVIEAYLEATLVLRDPAQLAAHRDRIAQLKKEYDERHEFWIKSDLDPTLKTKLVEKSHSEVRHFWTAIQEGLLPALGQRPTAPRRRNPMRRSPRVMPRTAPSSTTSSSKPTIRTRRRKSRRPNASACSRCCCGVFPRWCFSSSAPASSAWHSASFARSLR